MILLIGGLGSIGSRYQAILNYIGVPFRVIDTADGLGHLPINHNNYEISKAIIATPTGTHVDYCHLFEKLEVPYLCEKPLATHQVIDGLVNGYVVCNYKYIIDPDSDIFYNYYKTGSDGLLWDCCQLIYLDPDAKLMTTSPRWHLIVDHRLVPYRELENSYVSMVRDFVKGNYKNLWTIEQGKEMTLAVLERMEREKLRNDSSKNELQETA